MSQIAFSVILEDHTNRSIENCALTNLSLESNLTVFELQQMYTESEDDDIYVIHRGDVANYRSTLSDVGIHDGAIIKIIVKKRQKTNENVYNEDLVKEIIKKHKQIMKTRFKQIINETLEKSLESVIEGDDGGVERCLLAHSVCSDHRLLRTLLSSTENITKLLQQCPVLIGTALKMINIIQDKLKKVNNTPQFVAEQPQDSSRYFSLGEVEQSDDDDEEEEEDSSEQQGEENSLQSTAPPAAAVISRSQLRAAVQSSTAASSAVSLAQLRTAMRTALSRGASAPQPMEVDEEPQEEGEEEKLRQLASMGFQDLQANREALRASRGDVEAAVELLLLR